MGVDVMSPNLREKLAAVGKLLTYGAAAAAVAWGGLFVYLMSAFLHSPLQPDQASGDVILWINHGTRHYVNRTEYHVYELLGFIGPIIGFVAFIGIFLVRGRRMFDRRH
ncbi:MAG: hypothetical protein HY243_06555 [Proteobacteria bacterium]|nr:hypothetical protein [Pseudomonadota bacterium]